MSFTSGRSQITDRLALDPNLSSGSFITAPDLPFTFAAGTSATFADITIPGGTIGPNGFVVLYAGGVYSASVLATVTVAFPGTGPTTTTTNVPTGTLWTWQAEWWAQTGNSETSLNLLAKIFLGRSGATSLDTFISMGTFFVDTTTDWQFTATLATSAAVFAAIARFGRIESRYIP